MMERLNGRLSLTLSALGLLLVLLVGWFGVVSPQRSKAAALSVKLDTAESRLRIAQDLVRGPALQESRVRILGITPTPAVAAGPADVVAITVAVEGRYFGIREFLRLLRAGADLKEDKVTASGRLFGVDAIQFSGGDTTGSMVQATLTVTAFSFRGAAATPGTTPGALSAPSEGVVAEAATP